MPRPVWARRWQQACQWPEVGLGSRAFCQAQQPLQGATVGHLKRDVQRLLKQTGFALYFGTNWLLCSNDYCKSLFSNHHIKGWLDPKLPSPWPSATSSNHPTTGWLDQEGAGPYFVALPITTPLQGCSTEPYWRVSHLALPVTTPLQGGSTIERRRLVLISLPVTTPLQGGSTGFVRITLGCHLPVTTPLQGGSTRAGWTCRTANFQ